ncbi:MAG: carbohydrate-binding domain-containing protein [Treponema sp.]|nr:carbohydrate-binding domain-containing protein [Treponema sp.]
MKKLRLTATTVCLLLILTGCIGKVSASDRANAITLNTPGSTQQAEPSNSIFHITSGGRYVLSGRHQGQIIIEAERNDIVELILDDVTLHNPNGPAIIAPRSQRVELILADGTINTISDGTHPNDDNNAAIYIQHDLIISGNGTLNVNGNYRHGIRTQGFLTINEGVFYVTAAGDALRGRNGITIQNGTFTLDSGGDGMQSSRESDPQRGFVTINGGTFTIRAGDDGIQAESTITINGGNITITAEDDAITTKGSVLITGGYIQVTDSYEGIEALNVTITGGDINIVARDDGINAREHGAGAGSAVRGRTTTRAPLNNNIFVRITGGSITIRAINGDGIDSNGHIFLEGGTLNITGPFGRIGEDAIDLDGNFIVTGGQFITAGNIRSISPQSTQPVILFRHNRQLPAGTLIEMRDTRGYTLLSYVAKGTFNVSGFTSPGFAIGLTYSLYINREKVSDITLNNIFTRQ